MTTWVRSKYDKSSVVYEVEYETNWTYKCVKTYSGVSVALHLPKTEYVACEPPGRWEALSAPLTVSLDGEVVILNTKPPIECVLPEGYRAVRDATGRVVLERWEV